MPPSTVDLPRPGYSLLCMGPASDELRPRHSEHHAVAPGAQLLRASERERIERARPILRMAFGQQSALLALAWLRQEPEPSRLMRVWQHEVLRHALVTINVHLVGEPEALEQLYAVHAKVPASARKAYRQAHGALEDQLIARFCQRVVPRARSGQLTRLCLSPPFVEPAARLRALERLTLALARHPNDPSARQWRREVLRRIERQRSSKEPVAQALAPPPPRPTASAAKALRPPAVTRTAARAAYFVPSSSLR